MGRPVEVRPNYRSDAAYLLRFEGALSKDESLPSEHRSKMMEAAHALSMLCMEADKLKRTSGA